jgi:hypothetical protein
VGYSFLKLEELHVFLNKEVEIFADKHKLKGILKQIIVQGRHANLLVRNNVGYSLVCGKFIDILRSKAN